MRGNKLIVISAPSGAGKSSIINRLLERDEFNLAFSVSATSRPPRPEEKEGREYYFKAVSEFRKHIENDDFIEWEEVYKDTFYGTLKSEIERLWQLGKNVIFDIDPVGGLNIKEKYPDRTLALFIEPPSIEELRQRLENRRTETADRIKLRMEKAVIELKSASLFDHIVVNDNIDTAVRSVYKLVRNFVK